MLLSVKKKKRIESLTTEEMAYEINLGRLSNFQRESFAYLKTCYELRKSKNESVTKIKDISPDPTTDNANNKHRWYKKPLGIIAIGVIIVVLGATTLWVLNHYFGLGL